MDVVRVDVDTVSLVDVSPGHAPVLTHDLLVAHVLVERVVCGAVSGARDTLVVRVPPVNLLLYLNTQRAAVYLNEATIARVHH